MSKEKINVILLVDESGSMSFTKEETKKAVSEYIQEQRKLDKIKLKLEVASFSSSLNTIFPLDKIKLYDNQFEKSYAPLGSTSLFDAIGITITKYKDCGVKTIVTILTDGQENSSESYNKEQVSSLIKEVQDELGWQVIFLASNLPDFNNFADSLNITAENRTLYSDELGGRSFALSFASTLTTQYLSGKP